MQSAECRIEVFSLCENDWDLWADNIRPYNGFMKTEILSFAATHVGDGVLDVPHFRIITKKSNHKTAELLSLRFFYLDF